MVMILWISFILDRRRIRKEKDKIDRIVTIVVFIGAFLFLPMDLTLMEKKLFCFVYYLSTCVAAVLLLRLGEYPRQQRGYAEEQKLTGRHM